MIHKGRRYPRGEGGYSKVDTCGSRGRGVKVAWGPQAFGGKRREEPCSPVRSKVKSRRPQIKIFTKIFEV